MLFEDSYLEVVDSSQGLFKDKGSKFISYTFHIKDEDDVKARMAEIRKKEYSARHYCYAYVLNPDKSIQRDSDDGEPSNTAGKPILGQLLSNDLTNTLIIVVRYFGGVKLGLGGLINAYRSATQDALQNSTIEKHYIKEVFVVHFQYPEMNNVMRVVKDLKLDVIKKKFEIECELTFCIRKSQSEKMQSIFALNHKVKLVYQKTI